MTAQWGRIRRWQNTGSQKSCWNSLKLPLEFIGGKYDCTGEGQQQLQTTVSISPLRARPISTNPKLPCSNKSLVFSARWVHDIKTDWKTDIRSKHSLDFDVEVLRGTNNGRAGESQQQFTEMECLVSQWWATPSSRGVARSIQTLSRRRGEPTSKHVEVSKEKECGYGSQRGPIPRIPVLAKPSSKLQDWVALWGSRQVLRTWSQKQASVSFLGAVTERRLVNPITDWDLAYAVVKSTSRVRELVRAL
jgi:hypothetical protein